MLLGLALLPARSHAEDPSVEARPVPEATIAELSGPGGTVTRAEGGETAAAREGLELFAGDRLVVPALAEVTLRFPDGTVARARAGSELVIGAKDASPSAAHSLLLLFGRLAAKVVKAALPSGASFEVHTMNSVAGVRGTAFEVMTVGDETEVLVVEGVVAVAGTIGDEVRVEKGGLAAVVFEDAARGERPGAPADAAGRFAELERRSNADVPARVERISRLLSRAEEKLDRALERAEGARVEIESLAKKLELLRSARDQAGSERIGRKIQHAAVELRQALGDARAAGFRLAASQHRLERIGARAAGDLGPRLRALRERTGPRIAAGELRMRELLRIVRRVAPGAVDAANGTQGAPGTPNPRKPRRLR